MLKKNGDQIDVPMYNETEIGITNSQQTKQHKTVYFKKIKIKKEP